MEQSTSKGCSNPSVHNSPPIKLPTEFEDLNNGYKDIHPAAIEENTRAQSSSAEWFNARKCRLTASNFGRVLRRKSAPSKKFLRSIFCPKSFSAPSVDYGRRNESKAKSKYLKKYPSRHFHECGLVINKEFMFLGATPDAKLSYHSIWEKSGNFKHLWLWQPCYAMRVAKGALQKLNAPTVLEIVQ